MKGRHQKSGRYLRTTPKKALSKRKILLVVACILLSAATFGGTLAYILTNTTSLTNKFTPAQISCEILEDFSNGTVKKDVCVQNTGDSPAYIRVKLLPYWYDKETRLLPKVRGHRRSRLGRDGFSAKMVTGITLLQ